MTSFHPLKTSAMIASFADPGQKTASAPFGHALVQAAQADDRIVGLTADLGKYTDMHIFAQQFPDRFFQMGMAEQLLFGAAAGMAENRAWCRSRPPTRCSPPGVRYDFICLDIAEPNLNVNVVGGLPGLTTGYGPSHQATEDIAIFRGMPNLTIVDPCDSVDIEQAVPQLAEHPVPTYLRSSSCTVPTVSTNTTTVRTRQGQGAARRRRRGADLVGLMIMRALQADEKLRRITSTSPSSMHRPSSRSTLNRSGAGGFGPSATDGATHTVVGGLFETVASAAVRRGIANRSRRSAYLMNFWLRRLTDPARPVRPVDAAVRRARCSRDCKVRCSTGQCDNRGSAQCRSIRRRCCGWRRPVFASRR